MKCAYLKTLKMPLAAAFALAAFSAQAADMYAPGVSSKDVPVYEAVPTWAGFYLGVNSGYGWGAKSSTLGAAAFDGSVPLVPVTAFGTSKLSTEGGFGGGQLGYNWQRDRFVFGVETDIQGAAIKGNTVTEAAVPGATPVALPTVETVAFAKSTLDWFGTARARLGYSAGNTLFFGNTLLYATGGFAYGGVRDTLGMELTSQNAGTSTVAGMSRNGNLTGWVVGGGVEVALSPSWSAKAEYQYIDLGSTTLAAAALLPYSRDPVHIDAGGAAVKIDHTYNTVRLGLNYRFNQVYEPLK